MLFKNVVKFNLVSIRLQLKKKPQFIEKKIQKVFELKKNFCCSREEKTKFVYNNIRQMFVQKTMFQQLKQKSSIELNKFTKSTRKMDAVAIVILCLFIITRCFKNVYLMFKPKIKKSKFLKSPVRNLNSNLKHPSTLTAKVNQQNKSPKQKLNYMVFWRDQHLNLTKFFSIDIEINGVDISGWIDTLSNITLIHKQVVKKLKLKCRRSPKLNLYLANSTIQKIKSQVMVEIRSPSNKFENVYLNAFIVDDLHFSVILGTDFNTKAYTIIDYLNSTVKFGTPTDFWHNK